MRLLGLDVGDKTIGVAVSDPLGLTAQGVEVIRRQGRERDLVRLQELVQSYGVDTIVMGLPKNMDGSLGKQAEKVMAFADLVQKNLDLPVVLWDERLTTMAAERALLEADLSRGRRREVIDKMAAVLILQGYLDRQRKEKP
ncbi:MAG: Holliday junction resolvase RuvX [bacterium]|jgi:putative Holliday junction resolvase|nr:Holliday junction resolvase RuvX [Bacillota bacterium]HHW55547.1 Holliday junction resolvase RuvX [Bacillota bacterium]